MGWASGSSLACSVWDVVRPHIPADKRQEVAAKILELLEYHDADDFSTDDELIVDARGPACIDLPSLGPEDSDPSTKLTTSSNPWPNERER